MVAIIGLKLLDSGIITILETKRPGARPGLSILVLKRALAAG
jgi:hypothetical protein